MRICILLILSVAFAANSHASSFVLTFFDGAGTEVGFGSYGFATIPADTNTSFDDLSDLDWSFNLPDYGIAISSSVGDSSSRESTADEGVFVTVIGSILNLRFFDSVGSFISHNDESSLPARTSVRFVENSNMVEYIKDDATLDTGTFSAVAVPEAASFSLITAIFAMATIAKRRSFSA